jgi:hypothetical protein
MILKLIEFKEMQSIQLEFLKYTNLIEINKKIIYFLQLCKVYYSKWIYSREDKLIIKMSDCLLNIIELDYIIKKSIFKEGSEI